MPGPETPTELIFARPPRFTIRLRRGRRLRWPGGAATDYNVLVPLEGSFSYSARGPEDRGYVFRGGALLAAPNDTVEASCDGAARCLALALSPVFVLDCATRAGMARAGTVVGFGKRAVAQDERLSRLALDLADELQADEIGSEVVVTSLVEQALIHILRRHGAAVRADRIELSRAGLVDRRVRRAVELMHAHLDRDLPLEELAAAAHLSPFHFARLFKKLTGAPPHAYLASLRASRAQALLAETDLTITEIGSRVGYANPSHFSRAFRRATGTTPRAYRRSLIRL